MISLDQAGAGLSVTRRVPVPDSLAAWVEGAWIQGMRWTPGETNGPTAPTGWLVVPDPCAHVIVSRSPGGRVRAAVVGPRSRAVEAAGRRSLTVGVRLRPGALPRIVRDEARLLTDRSIPLAELDRAVAEEALAAAEGHDGAGALRVLRRFLRRRLEGAGPVDWRVRALDAELREVDAVVTPGDVARAYGVSSRGLRAVAAAELGLSPSLHIRIRRLQRALRLRLSGATGSWARTALAGGYHDASHLVRDARVLLGETPGAYLRRADPYNAPGAAPA